MDKVKFTATALLGGKTGILPKDSDGYYTLPVGGLNVYNNLGEFYTLEGAKELFTDSSYFMRRVSSRCLKAEVGHPKQTIGMTIKDYIRRILTIDPNNVCGHFKEVWLDTEFGKKQSDPKHNATVAIMAKVKPAGEKSLVLESALNDPHENVCFSIRALTNDYFKAAQKFRVLDTIVTFDYVIEPGISYATKYNSPSLESREEQILLIEQLESLYEEKLNCPVSLESKELIDDIVKNINSRKIKTKKPVYTSW
jgi:hypothetical protein